MTRKTELMETKITKGEFLKKTRNGKKSKEPPRCLFCNKFMQHYDSEHCSRCGYYVRRYWKKYEMRLRRKINKMEEKIILLENARKN